MADLNKFEAELRGEFGIGSAAQFGSADLRCGSLLLYLFIFINTSFRIQLQAIRVFSDDGVFLLSRKAVHVNENFRLSFLFL